ncbi:MAG: autotransporter outer membrane beta-barrel domain-containing protein, partial [Comamonadaceae bacterium]
AAPAPPPPLLVEIPTYRVEVPLLAALPQQLRQGDLSMLGNLHQRVGDTPATGRDELATRGAWARLVSSDATLDQAGTVSPRSDGRRTGLQVGTDLYALEQVRAGIYVGQLDGDMSVRGFARGLQGLPVGHSDLRSQYLGTYLTWRSEEGFYADAVLQAARHRARLMANGGVGTAADGESLLASIEIGQSYELGGGWMLEPQAQVIHGRMRLDEAVLSGATTVRQDADSTWRLRLGARLHGRLETEWGTLKPYVRVNFHETLNRPADVARFVAPAGITAITSEAGGASSELAAGFNLDTAGPMSFYGELGRLWAGGGGARDASSLQGSLGLRVRW